MKRFPNPSSTTPKEIYPPGSFYSIDQIPMQTTSCRGYTNYALMIDIGSDKLFNYKLKTEGSEDFLDNFKAHFAINHDGRYPLVVNCKNLLSDNGNQVMSQIFLEF
jgi:hypothetical protein